jgi:hypothetical protein
MGWRRRRLFRSWPIYSVRGRSGHFGGGFKKLRYPHLQRHVVGVFPGGFHDQATSRLQWPHCAFSARCSYPICAVCALRINNKSRPTNQRFHSLNFFSHQLDTNRPFRFQKRSQLFVGAHDETRSVMMRVHTEPANATSGFNENVGDDFPNTSRG